MGFQWVVLLVDLLVLTFLDMLSSHFLSRSMLVAKCSGVGKDVEM